jgi:putative Holliday junction resolvase
MAVIDILAMKAALAPGGRLFGLDIGSKTIGIAVSDSALRVASPLVVVPRVKFAADMAKLKGLIAERSVGGLVLGLPIGLDGREGPRSQSVRQFAANLLAVIDLPLAFWDERFSTLGAERPMREAEMSHRRRGELIDKLAAAYILQGALDRIAASHSTA